MEKAIVRPIFLKTTITSLKALLISNTGYLSMKSHNNVILLAEQSSKMAKGIVNILAKRGFNTVRCNISQMDDPIYDKIVLGNTDQTKGHDFRGCFLIILNEIGIALSRHAEAGIAVWDDLVEHNIQGIVRIINKLMPDVQSPQTCNIIHVFGLDCSDSEPFSAVNEFTRRMMIDIKAENLYHPVRITNLEILSKLRSDKYFRNGLEIADVAECLCWVLSRPERVNISHLQISSTES